MEILHTSSDNTQMTPDPFTKSSLFEQAVRAILRPLVRALIAQGITAPAFYRIIKQTYVEVATDAAGDAATDSQVSVMTGVHRRDVKTLRAADTDADASVARKSSTLATVVGRWITQPDLSTPTGAPSPLPRSAASPPSFDHLVQSVSRDVRPRAVLDELERQSIVSVDADGLVHLNPAALVGPADLDQKLHFFSENLGDHMNAAVENLLADGQSPFLERAVFYNHLTKTSVTAIEQDVRTIGIKALQDINTRAAHLQNADKTDPDATMRFRFGVFLYSDDDGPADNISDQKGFPR